MLIAFTAAWGFGAGVAAADQPSTWNFSQAKVPGAQGLGRHGSGATVAVLDTWIDHTHPDLQGRVVGHAHCVGGRCQPQRYSPDSCTHGTHVAGTVASARYGVAPQAGVLAVQVLSYSSGGCSGSTGDVAAGIRYATARRVDVINLSLGTLVPGLFTSSAVKSAVRDAARAGIVVVFAAGNSTVPLSDNYGSDALLVAATGPSGRLASYSTRGGAVALAAPGGDAGLSSCKASNCILSTTPNKSYRLMQGTSMAAPHVSGTAALLAAQNPGRGRASIMNALQSTARPLSGTRHGLLDATAALRVHTPQPAPKQPQKTAAPPARAVPQTTAPAAAATPPPPAATTTPNARKPTTTKADVKAPSPEPTTPPAAAADPADGAPSGFGEPESGGPPVAELVAAAAVATVLVWLLVVRRRPRTTAKTD